MSTNIHLNCSESDGCVLKLFALLDHCCDALPPCLLCHATLPPLSHCLTSCMDIFRIPSSMNNLELIYQFERHK